MELSLRHTTLTRRTWSFPSNILTLNRSFPSNLFSDNLILLWSFPYNLWTYGAFPPTYYLLNMELSLQPLKNLITLILIWSFPSNIWPTGSFPSSIFSFMNVKALAMPRRDLTDWRTENTENTQYEIKHEEERKGKLTEHTIEMK